LGQGISGQHQGNALNAFWDAGGGHPLAVLATGTGKSVLIAKLLQDIAAGFPDLRAAVLVHVRELLEQISIICYGFGRMRLTVSIVLGLANGIGMLQSYWPTFRAFGAALSVLACVTSLSSIAHLVPHEGDGMYRSLFDGLQTIEPCLRVCGFTATPYRLDTGRLDEGDGKIFDKVVFEYNIGDGIRDGWLAPLSSKATAAKINVSGVAIRGGEFVPGALEDAADNEKIVAAAVDEIISCGRDRRSWLLFCCGVRHARHVRDVLTSRGISSDARASATLVLDEKNDLSRSSTSPSMLPAGTRIPPRACGRSLVSSDAET
jgi:DNA repair protein RadD